jgi:molybdopterin molybdotransferase
MIGLPGNPVSSFVCGLLFVKPAIEALSGLTGAAPTRQTARLGVALAANDQREDYLRAEARLDETGRLTVAPFAKQDSSMLSLLARANCLLVRAPHAPAASVGDMVEIIPFGEAL